MSSQNEHPVTAAAILVTLGIIFGDIGTSPLYVVKAIAGEHPITPALAMGAFSAIFWTLTLLTTIKYVGLTLRADNNGEGGIFSLYALVRRRAKWLMIPAIIGGSALLADGMITPPISVASAVEGLRQLYPDFNTVPVVLVIIFLLFSVQGFGTVTIGASFGYVMFIWFSMLGVMGIRGILSHPEILNAVDPRYALHLLIDTPGGFWLLGSVFLATTGAEALYSDLGHCGKTNIRITWAFVKAALLLNYAGQSAWLMGRIGSPLSGENPFYELMPEWFLLAGIVIATCATVIASQAVISGSFTLIAEAIRLNIFPKLKVVNPTNLRGQVYVPAVSTLLFLGCAAIVLHFRESSNMEAAYGLAITLAMLSTTVLLSFFLKMRGASNLAVGMFLFTYILIEGMFLVANLKKFPAGGWVALFVAILTGLVMWAWNRGHRLSNRFNEYVSVRDYLPLLDALSQDASVPKFATHLVFLTPAPSAWQVDAYIIDSILRRQPKRADVYWFLHIEVVDDPHTLHYQVTPLLEGKVFRLDFFLGFRVEPRINLLFRKAIGDLARGREVDVLSRYDSLRKNQINGDFRFVILRKFLSRENNLDPKELFLTSIYYFLKRFSLSQESAFGLDTSLVTIEKIPLVISPVAKFDLTRVYDEGEDLPTPGSHEKAEQTRRW